VSLNEIIKFDTKLLVTFYVTAQELHFGRAAERLNMTTPPLSRQIRRLEALVGEPLFIRSTRSVELTPLGVYMLGEVHEVLRSMDHMISSVLNVVHDQPLTLAVGLTPGIVHTPLIEKIYQYHSTRSNIQLTIKEFNTVDMPNALRSEEVHVAFLRPNVFDPDIKLIKIAREPMCLIRRLDDLTFGNTVSLAELSNYPLINYHPTTSPYLRSIINTLCERLDVNLHFVQESQLPTMITFVEAGIGRALVPQAVAQSRYQFLTYSVLEEANIAYVETVIGMLRLNTNPIVDDFVQTILRM